MINGTTKSSNISVPHFGLKLNVFIAMIIILIVLFTTLNIDFNKGDGYQHKELTIKLQNEPPDYTKYTGGLIGDCREDCNSSLDNGW